MVEDETEENQAEIRIPENEASVIALVEEEKDGGLSEQEKNVAIAQAKVIGDI